MSGTTVNMSRFGIIAIVLTVVCVAGISDAYSYSSTVVSTENTISANYLSINAYENTYGGEDVVADDFYFNIPGTEAWYDYGSATFELTTLLSVRVTSNSVDSAYVYGYFKAPNSFAGIAVKSIEFLCKVYDAEGNQVGTRTMCLFKDYISGHQFGEKIELNAAEKEGQTVYYYDMVISQVTVNYYPDITFVNGSVDIDAGGIHEHISLETATNPIDFSYHFLAARDPLLGVA